MKELSVPRFTLAQVTAAAGAKPNTLHNWFHRGLLTLGKFDLPAPSPGATTLVTGRTALALGIALVLTKDDVPVERAIRAGHQFANTGAGRRPAFLFSGPDVLDTYIVFSRGQDREDVHCAIVPRKSEMLIEDLLSGGPNPINSFAWFSAFPLLEVVNSLRSSLGLPEDRGD